MNKTITIEVEFIDNPLLPELTEQQMLEIILAMETQQNMDGRRIHLLIIGT